MTNIIEALRNDSDFDYIKKEALIHFGFKPIPTEEFTYWYEKERWESEPEELEELKAFKGNYIDLLTSKEKEVIGEVNEEQADNPNRVVKWLLEDGTLMDVTRSDKRKERFKLANKLDWYKRGQELKQKRTELGLSLTKLAQMIGTSPSRITNFEQGEAVLMANQLAQSYKLALEHFELTNKNSNLVNHVLIRHQNDNTFTIYLVMADSEISFVENYDDLSLALIIIADAFKNLDVQVYLEDEREQRMLVGHSKDIKSRHIKSCKNFLKLDTKVGA